MAFNSLLRKSVSSLRPLVSHSLKTHQNYQVPLCTAINRGTFSRKASLNPFIPCFHFSSAEVKKVTSDESLLRANEYKIRCAEETDDHSMSMEYVVYVRDKPEDPKAAEKLYMSMVQNVLSSKFAPEALLNSHSKIHNGFLVRLTEEKAERMREIDGVISVFPKINAEFHGFPGGNNFENWIESDTFKELTKWKQSFQCFPHPEYVSSYKYIFTMQGTFSLIASFNPFVPSFHFLSAKLKKAISDQSLLLAITYEILSAEKTDEHHKVEHIPSDFPFEIDDNPGKQTIILQRIYQGEEIKVEVHMPNLVTREDNNDGDNDNDGKWANQLSIPLVVSVFKKDGSFLEFSCMAFLDEITIDSLTIKNPKNAEDQIAYEGLVFQDLDENLQKAFHKYLEIRGIKLKTTNFLHEYMIDKESKEYIAWMKKLRKFIEA